MKKTLAILMAALMLLGLTACSSAPEATTEPAATAEQTEQTAAPAEEKQSYTVGICQLVQHPALDAATQGFKDVLTEQLGDSVTIEEGNASNDIPTCATIVNGFVSSEVDLIMANATPALQAAVAATNTIPILGTSVTEYGVALNISDFSGTVGGNVSGTSDLAPLDQQEDMLVSLYPAAKNVGILYCSAEPNSVCQATEFGKYLDEDGISHKEYTVADSNDIASVVQSAVSEVDVIYIPTDNTMAGNTEAIDNITRPAGIPVIAGEEGICSGWGVATSSISYYDIGYKFWDAAANKGKSATLLQDFLKRYRLDQTTGIDLNGETSGRIPTPEWKQEYYRDTPEDAQWKGGDYTNMCIGQGYVLVTPMEIAVAYGAIASGNIVKPHLLKEVRNAGGDVALTYQPQVLDTPDVSMADLAVVRNALRGVTTDHEEIAKLFTEQGIDPDTGACKSGTAEYTDMEDTAWFACYAPYDDPKYVIACVVEHGGGGSSVAAPIGAQVMAAALSSTNASDGEVGDIAGSSGKSEAGAGKGTSSGR